MTKSYGSNLDWVSCCRMLRNVVQDLEPICLHKQNIVCFIKLIEENCAESNSASAHTHNTLRRKRGSTQTCTNMIMTAVNKHKINR